MKDQSIRLGGITFSKQRSRSILRIAAAMTLVLVLSGTHRVYADGTPAQQPHQPSLFERTPPGFSWQTVDEMHSRVLDFPEFIEGLPDRARKIVGVIGPGGVALRLSLLLALVVGLFLRRRVVASIVRGLSPLASLASGKSSVWISSIIQVIATSAVPVALWLLYLLVRELTRYENPAFVVIGIALLAWTKYTIAMTSARELVTRPLLPVPEGQRSYLVHIARWLLVYGIVVDALLHAQKVLGAPADVIALRRWLFELSLILFLAVAFLRRRAIMSLFPELANRPYTMFVRGLDRVYPLAFVLTLLTALLQWAGFRRLAIFVWFRTWVLAGVFFLAVLLHSVLRSALRRLILGETEGSLEARTFYLSCRRLLDYVGSIIVILIALRLTDLNYWLLRVLGVPLGTVSGRPLSVLVLIEGAAIVAGFIFVAQLLRDYLQFQVYPALNVDPGVARAIDTFLVYSLAGIGGLAALEAVGLGVGTITLFAGAIGVGLGFGLQSIANNFASGLTIIFSRELRRGDIITVGDTVGIVEQVGTRATRMRTRDDIEYVVPNADLVSGKIINWTRSNPNVRVHVPVGVSYDASPTEVRAILERVAASVPVIEHLPAPEVRFKEFGDNSLNFELLVWANVRINPPEKVISVLNFAIFEALKEAGIEIPFPQRDVRIRSAEGLVAFTK
ncbi:MAG TPA: mechanosensitive ion channel domain-containing protein, partial [Candidatus Binataceae bacterium]|nr:mechanosensitive ion channel domain-containing protein [Candidatus Binataceae bacterium]